MVKWDRLTEVEIFSDFDGTITLMDSTVELEKRYGNEQTRQDERMFIAGEITNRKAMIRHYQNMRLTEEMYYEVLRSIPLDPGFARFYAHVKELGGSIKLLTANATIGVQNYLQEKGFDDIEVYGNRMEAPNGIINLYCADEIADTLCETGSCAHCKSNKVSSAQKQGKKTIYIGDGLTDVCAAKYADVLFAKYKLADYCEEHEIPFVRYDSFDDICEYLF